jgi:hypothetical protein
MVQTPNGTTYQYFDYLSLQISKFWTPSPGQARPVPRTFSQSQDHKSIVNRQLENPKIPSFMKIYQENDFTTYAAFLFPFLYNPYYTMIKTNDGHYMEYFDFIGYRFAKAKNELLVPWSMQARIGSIGAFTAVCMKLFTRSWAKRFMFGPALYIGLCFCFVPEVLDGVLLSPSSLWIEEYGKFEF